MTTLLDDVRAFHEMAGIPVRDTPAMPTLDRCTLRDRLLREEFNEFVQANKQGDIVEIADALADIIYICVGTALEYGIPLDKVWDEVHRSNMAKANPATGKVNRRADGKILKPEGWTPPDVRGVLGL